MMRSLCSACDSTAESTQASLYLFVFTRRRCRIRAQRTYVQVRQRRCTVVQLLCSCSAANGTSRANDIGSSETSSAPNPSTQCPTALITHPTRNHAIMDGHFSNHIRRTRTRLQQQRQRRRRCCSRDPPPHDQQRHCARQFWSAVRRHCNNQRNARPRRWQRSPPVRHAACAANCSSAATIRSAAAACPQSSRRSLRSAICQSSVALMPHCHCLCAS